MQTDKEENKKWYCKACNKELYTDYIECVTCKKIYHTGCVFKHRIRNEDNELVKCMGKKVKLNRKTEEEKARRRTVNSEEKSDKSITQNTQKQQMSAQKHTKTVKRTERNEDGNQTEDIENNNMEENVEKILKIVKETKDNSVSRNEIRKIVNEAIAAEVNNLKREIEQIKLVILNINKKSGVEQQTGPRSYVEVAKTTAKTVGNILIVKPKEPKCSEETKNEVLEKIKIKELPVGVSRVTKGNKGMIIIGCESEKEINQLKLSMDTEIGADFEAIIPKQKQPKIKIVGISQEDMELEDQSILETIKVQNELDGEKFHMKIVKRGNARNKNNDDRMKRGEEGTLIIETDVETHKKLINKGKVNLGWKRCKVYDFVSVLRCFKCWGYNHMAKYCKKEEVCEHCAGNHRGKECKSDFIKCVNCSERIKRYNNNNIKDDHEATDKECPTYQWKTEEEKRKTANEDE